MYDEKFIFLNDKKCLQTYIKHGKILITPIERQVLDMKIKPEYQLRNIAGDYVVVATGGSLVDLANSFTLNESGAVLWKALENENDEEGVIAVLKAEYDVSHEQAKQDVLEFVEFLKERDMLL